MNAKTEQQDKLEMLKDLLFPEEQETLSNITGRISLLEQLLHDQKKLASKIDPLIDQKLQLHNQVILENMGPAFYNTLQKEIREHPDKMSEILSPLMGSLLRKRRREKRRAFFSALGSPFRNFGKFLNGVGSRMGKDSQEKQLEKQLKSNVIEQVLLIDRRNGALKASYSETQKITLVVLNEICATIDTYITKNRVQKDQHLETIPFKNYHIYLQRFVTHYVAVITSGKKDLPCPEKLQDIIFTFYYKFMALNLDLLQEGKEEKKGKKTIDKGMLEQAMATCFKNNPL
jgi:hypothetical protein